MELLVRMEFLRTCEDHVSFIGFYLILWIKLVSVDFCSYTKFFLPCSVIFTFFPSRFHLIPRVWWSDLLLDLDNGHMFYYLSCFVLIPLVSKGAYKKAFSFFIEFCRTFEFSSGLYIQRQSLVYKYLSLKSIVFVLSGWLVGNWHLVKWYFWYQWYTKFHIFICMHHLIRIWYVMHPMFTIQINNISVRPDRCVFPFQTCFAIHDPYISWYNRSCHHRGSRWH